MCGLCCLPHLVRVRVCICVCVCMQVSLEKALATVEVKVPSHTDAFNMLPKLVETVKELGFEAEPVIDGLA